MERREAYRFHMIRIAAPDRERGRVLVCAPSRTDGKALNGRRVPVRPVVAARLSWTVSRKEAGRGSYDPGDTRIDKGGGKKRRLCGVGAIFSRIRRPARTSPLFDETPLPYGWLAMQNNAARET